MLPKAKQEVIEELLQLSKANGTSVLEECVAYCDREGIEVETLAAAIRTSKTGIKDELESDGQRLNLLKKKP